MSSRELNDECRSLLSKGCKFTPHPKANFNELQEDVKEFCRKIRLIDYFKDKPINRSGMDLKYERTNFIPPKGINSELDAILDLIDKKVSEYVPTNNKMKSNVTRSEFEIMMDLKKDNSLHITKADKGGAFVVLDNEFYINQMMKEHTSDTATYKKIDKYAPHSTMEHIINFCKMHTPNCQLTKKEISYITKFNYNLPTLYGLPKIHKLDTSLFRNMSPDKYGYIRFKSPESLKFRPIISSSYAPTSRLSAFIDEILKPLVPELHSYCRDTSHFLEKLERESNIIGSIRLTSFDIVSLYTSIPHDLGLESIKFWLERQRTLIPERFSDFFILSSIELILKNNYFCFRDEVFLQISGTAMGTKMAPTYAILVVGFLEEKMYTRIKEIYSENISNNIICGWIRYIDDCWIVWKESYGDINILKRILQSLHPSIQFTMETSDNRLNFLDVNIYKDGDKLETDIYHKASDSRSYVPFTSAHPKHILNNIPYTLAKRIHLIVSNPDRRDIQLNELKHTLMKLKYPETLIDNAFLRATTPQVANNRFNERKLLPFISRFNKNNPNIYNEIILPACHSLGLINPFNNYRFIKAFSQPQSLLRILNNNDKETFKGITKCNESRCGCCETLITGKNISFTVNNETKNFKIKCNMNCLSLNVIYALICRGCNKFYIGQTGGMFRKRLTLHRQHINNPQYAILEVSRHIATCAKSLKPPFSASPILKLSPRCTREHREEREKGLISFLKPQLNKD